MPQVDRLYNHYQVTADWLNSVQNIVPGNIAMRAENKVTYLTFIPCGPLPSCNDIVGFANITGLRYDLVPEYLR